MSAYVMTGTPLDIDALKRSIEERRYIQKKYPVSFISQDKFNHIIRVGTVYEVALVIETHPEMVIGFDSMNMSPLMAAADRTGIALKKLEDVVSLLIKAGARMSANQYWEATPLCYAATKSAEVFDVFLKYETNWELYESFVFKPWQTALYSSPEKFLMALPYIPESAFKSYSANGYTLLIEVIVRCPAVTTAVLANRHASATVNRPDRNGETPLAHAAKLDRHRGLATRALLRKGATLLYQRDGKSIFYTEVRNDRSRGVEYIRDRITHSMSFDAFDHRYDHWYK